MPSGPVKQSLFLCEKTVAFGLQTVAALVRSGSAYRCIYMGQQSHSWHGPEFVLQSKGGVCHFKKKEALGLSDV